MAPNGTHRGEEAASYALCAVVRLTGLSSHVIRAWERRYGAVRPMRQIYRFALPLPGERLSVRITSLEAGAPLFHARLALRRREITGGRLARALLRYPWMPAQGIAAIYWQAWRLRRKGAPVHPHPREARAALREAIR